MSRKLKYLLIIPDEDGAPNRFMTEKELMDYLNGEDPRDIEEGCRIQDLNFMGEKELREQGYDQNYWCGDEVVLLEIKFIKPVVKTLVTEWKIEGNE